MTPGGGAVREKVRWALHRRADGRRHRVPQPGWPALQVLGSAAEGRLAAKPVGPAGRNGNAREQHRPRDGARVIGAHGQDVVLEHFGEGTLQGLPGLLDRGDVGLPHVHGLSRPPWPRLGPALVVGPGKTCGHTARVARYRGARCRGSARSGSAASGVLPGCLCPHPHSRQSGGEAARQGAVISRFVCRSPCLQISPRTTRRAFSTVGSCPSARR